MKHIILILMICLGVLACDRQEPEPRDPADPGIVTGLQLWDGLGQPLGTLGNPNERVSQSSRFKGLFFPNPFASTLHLANADLYTKYWLVPVEKDTNFQRMNFDSLFQDVDIDTLMFTKDAQSSGRVTDSISVADINTEGLADGYYRAYLQNEDGEVVWRHVFRTRSNLGMAQILDSMMIGWE